MPSPEHLHQHFPVEKEQIEEEISKKYPKLKNIKLSSIFIYVETKRLMIENLLKISMAVHLSKEKME